MGFFEEGKIDGAKGGTRTHTLSLAADFESAASTNSATLARQNCILERTGIAPEQLHCTQRQADVAEAHAAGLSVGKYRAYLELREVLPDVTVEDVQRLTMREIRDLLEQAGQGGDGVGGRGPGFGQGNGYGAGSGNGNAR